METPKISFCIGAYNVQDYVVECLESIKRQTYKNFEISIIDDCSTDATYSVIEKWKNDNPRISIVLGKNGFNLGPAASFNRAVGSSTGKYICFIDADDFFLGNFLDKRLKTMEFDPELKVIYADGWRYINGKILDQNIHSHLKTYLDMDLEVIQSNLVTSVPLFLLQGSIFRRDFFDAIEGFDEDVISNDWVLNIRSFQHFKTKNAFIFDSTPVFAYRIHSNSLSKDPEKMFVLFSRVIQKYTPGFLQKKAFENIGFLTALNFLRQGNKVRSSYFELFFQHSLKKIILYRIARLLPRSILQGENKIIILIKNLILFYFQ